MARAVGDTESRRRIPAPVRQQGSQWIDANLFNGEYYIQKVRGWPKDQIAPALRSDMGADDTENPQYQVATAAWSTS